MDFHDFDLRRLQTPEPVLAFMERELGTAPLKITVIEWLAMQNPDASFTDDRPQLPGQTHPGLHVAKQLMQMVFELARKQGRDALLNFPEHFHNAWLYSRRGLFFLNPAFEGNSIEQEVEKKKNTLL
jgi:hypothetical protein